MAAASTMSALLSLEWAEEVLILLLVYILLFKTFKEFGIIGGDRLKKKAAIKKSMSLEAKMQFEEAADRDLTSSTCRQPSQVLPPVTSLELPGVTDRRFTGEFYAYHPEGGFGFIKCPELSRQFTKRVFLHRLQKQSFEVGDRVSFGVFLNPKGWPQAKDLALEQQDGLASKPTEETQPKDLTLEQRAGPASEPAKEAHPKAWSESTKDWSSSGKSGQEESVSSQGGGDPAWNPAFDDAANSGRDTCNSAWQDQRTYGYLQKHREWYPAGEGYRDSWTDWSAWASKWDDWSYKAAWRAAPSKYEWVPRRKVHYREVCQWVPKAKQN